MLSLDIMLFVLIIPTVWLVFQIYVKHVDPTKLTGMMGFAVLMIIIWALPVLVRFNQAANIVKNAKEGTLMDFKRLRYDLRL